MHSFDILKFLGILAGETGKGGETELGKDLKLGHELQ